jgi:hypothetical protein
VVVIVEIVDVLGTEAIGCINEEKESAIMDSIKAEKR